MNTTTLAVKYRPKKWDDVVEQGATKSILEQQLESNTFKHAYLFCGSSGTGKTTCARIFASEINNNCGGEVIEIDGATHSGVDSIKEIVREAMSKSLSGGYKIIIMDECHVVSNTGWQSLLKLIEEPPLTTVFIFCTTNPERIPSTILGRVQRYDFHKISYDGIVDRLKYVVRNEHITCVEDEALNYIAKLASGGMRDAITMLDKCLAYSNDLTIYNVVKSLGSVDYVEMFGLTDAVIKRDIPTCLEVVDNQFYSGKDIKLFISQYTNFVLDILKFGYGCSYKYLNLPETNEVVNKMTEYLEYRDLLTDLFKELVKLNSDSKWSTTAKEDLDATLVLFVVGGKR